MGFRFHATLVEVAPGTLVVAPTTTSTRPPTSAEGSVELVPVASIGIFVTVPHESGNEHSCHS
jgi:hypothetical protein